jgi:ATP/maltotriose-dependent transcriptional regulator MalT
MEIQHIAGFEGAFVGSALSSVRLTSAMEVAWLSLDGGDRDLNQFAAYLTASLRSVSADVGDGALALAQAPTRCWLS